MQISTDAIIEHAAAIAALDGVDPESLTGDQASEWLASLARVRTSAEAIMATLARRIETLSTVEAGRARYARAKGFAGAPSLVAQRGQMSTGEANRLLSVGKAMADADAGLGAGGLLVGESGQGYVESGVLFETLSRAVAAGVLASEKAATIRGLLETLSAPTVALERALVKAGIRMTPVELGRRCDRELEADHVALREREKRQRARRYATFYRDSDGMVGFRGLLDPVTAAPFVTAIEGEVRKKMITERDLPEGERRDAGQIRADAFAAMANHWMGCEDPATGTKTVIVATVAEEALTTGEGIAHCHALSGPISVEALRQFAVDIAVMPAVMRGVGLPLDLGRATRCFTPAQRLAIAVRDQGCARCGEIVARCDVHHITFWSMNGRSDIDNGVLLCVGCHHRLHEYGWELQVYQGHVWFMPPAKVDPEREWVPAFATPVGAPPPLARSSAPVHV